MYLEIRVNSFKFQTGSDFLKVNQLTYLLNPKYNNTDWRTKVAARTHIVAIFIANVAVFHLPNKTADILSLTSLY